jgi:hypothetical protein
MTSKITRDINGEYLKRADSVDSSQVGSYMESIAISLHEAIDNWRFHDAPVNEVSTYVDALVAMWTSIEMRSHE